MKFRIIEIRELKLLKVRTRIARNCIYFFVLPSRNSSTVIKILATLLYATRRYIYLARIILSKSRYKDELRSLGPVK